ncbi:hypothetical protein J596_0217 [Acinetobacter baumannii 21072]|uniref:Uncharacterized protein n=1 Tax=Acinetobacter baumannii 21072 TaxID=1310697 RepID=A0A062IYL8_ACIBA|nr:hypothetical protein [Acinetobacter baumannii]KCY22998.1 hypothetical protein J596_0217 [Acinetobacter baumannii 21072]
MSEFKVGDHIVIDQKYDKTFMPVLQILSEGKNYFYCNDGQVHKSQMDQWRKAEPQEITAGHRIDFPTLPKPVGSLQELHPEFAKVLHENFLELLGDESNTVQMVKDAVEHGHGFAMVSIEGVEHVSRAQVINPFPCEELGDDFPIENHISPHCQSRDV